MKKYSLSVLFFLFTIESFSQASLLVNLNSNWQFNYNNTWYSTSVPNSIHTDLLEHRLIANPFYRDNESHLQWIGQRDWQYKTEFDADTSLLKKQNVQLILRGLDTYADIYLNHTLILKTDNMFREWTVECKKFLHTGKNELLITFHPAEKIAKEQYEKYPVKKLPGEERVMSRKAQYHFGWDFAPRFITCGIWKDVEIVAWDYFKINNVSFQTDSIKNNIAYMTGRSKIHANGHSPLHISVTDKVSGTLIVNVQTEIEPGSNDLQFQFNIANPKLWWCNGQGDSYLYSFVVEATDSSGNKNFKEAKTGVRTIEVIQQADTAGKSFYFMLNGHPVFIKGANYIPQDVFLNRVSDERYMLLINSVKEAGMNMLRVWGGGIYEKEKFYSLCDENGILIWQDFMFACGMYPFDEDFLNNIQEEAQQQVVRLSSYACMALWCGNNENSEGWQRWGWQNAYDSLQRNDIWRGYQKIFNGILPDAVKKYSNTFYWETSPEFGRGDVRHTKEGDAHNWFVWHDGEPFENYQQNVPRFMTEFGFQSMPELRTILSFCPDSELYISSSSMRAHQKHARGFAIINDYMQKEYGTVPKTFTEYIQKSQQLQADAVCTGINAHLNAKPYCMGTLFWQLNDCWPCVSWSAIDYFGRRKMLYTGVKNFFNGK